MGFNSAFKVLNAELNLICHLLALLSHPILHIGRISLNHVSRHSELTSDIIMYNKSLRLECNKEP